MKAMYRFAVCETRDSVSHQILELFCSHSGVSGAREKFLNRTTDESRIGTTVLFDLDAP
jgi:hypothetical protein